MSRRCRYCGNKPVTRDHVLPNWLVAHIGAQGRLSDEIRGSVRMGRLEVVSKHFCEACNSGWLNRLDEVARPLVVPMVKGEPITVSLDDQMLLSTWATRLFLGLEMTTPGKPRAFPPDRYHWFRRHTLPLPGTLIFIAGHANATSSSLRHITPMGGLSPLAQGASPEQTRPFRSTVLTLDHQYVLTIAIKHLIVQLWGCVIGRLSSSVTTEALGDVAHRIWPPSGEVVLWPREARWLGEKSLNTLAVPL